MQFGGDNLTFSLLVLADEFPRASVKEVLEAMEGGCRQRSSTKQERECSWSSDGDGGVPAPWVKKGRCECVVEQPLERGSHT